MTDAPSSPHLSVGLAIREGWQTFRRAPWPFVFFALAAFILSTLVDLIPGLAGFIATTLVSLWATIGFIRGAWIGLNGNSPQFGDFIAINPAAIWRLFSRQFILVMLLLAIGAAVLRLALLAADDPDQITALIPVIQDLAMTLIMSPSAIAVLLVGSLVGAYLQVNQAFLGYLAVIKGLGPIATIQRGITTVQGQWWQVLGLLVIQVVILLLGVCACGFGLLAAVPVVFGITASAYRQLFGGDDTAGLLNGR